MSPYSVNCFFFLFTMNTEIATMTTRIPKRLKKIARIMGATQLRSGDGSAVITICESENFVMFKDRPKKYPT